jgi:plastocyanin
MLRRSLAVAAVGAAALAGCGGGSSNSSSSGNGGGSGATVPVAADPGGALEFTTTKLKAKAGTVTFKFTNKSSVPHALEIEGHGVEAKTGVITGSSATVKIKLEPGSYEFYCPVDGHRKAGMEGTLNVS